MVRVTDPKDIAVLSHNPAFRLLIKIEEPDVDTGDTKLVSVDFLGINSSGFTTAQWSKFVWGVIGIRNNAMKKSRRRD